MYKIEQQTKHYYLDDDYFETILAALLHDIGKIFWRLENTNEIKNAYHKLRRRLGSDRNKNNKIILSSFIDYKHESLGKALLKGVVDSLDLNNKIYPKYFQDLSNNYKFERIIKLADHIAAGERKYRKEVSEEKELINIFDQNKKYPFPMKIEEYICGPEPKFQNQQYNKKDEKFIEFIEELLLEIRNILSEYQKIQDERKTKGNVENEVLRKKAILRAFEITLSNYLYYTTSAYFVAEPNIDLYSHSKLVSSLAAIIYILEGQDKEWFKINSEIFETLSKNLMDKNLSQKDKVKLIYKTILENISNQKFVEPKLVLIKGDFSGIQDFITNVKTKKGLKMMKAKSTYLNLLNKKIARYICEDIYNLPIFNIVSESGGTFQILAYDSHEKEKILEKEIQKINEKLFQQFGISIFLHVEIRKFPLFGLMERLYKIVINPDYEYEEDSIEEVKIVKSKFKEMLKKTKDENYYEISSKHRKFFNILKEKIENEGFLTIENEGRYSQEEQKECEYCHNIAKEVYDKEEDSMVCYTCKYLLLLVEKDLKNLEFGNIKELHKEFFSIRERFPREIRAIGDEEIKILKTMIKIYKENLNNVTSEFRYFNLKNLLFGNFVYGYPYIKENGKIKNIISFNCIREMDENKIKKCVKCERDKNKEKDKCDETKSNKKDEEENKKDLAILKIDLDNLGMIINKFSNTLSHYFRVSKDIQLFFEAKVDAIFKENYFNKYIYIIFSGGDDLVVVGREDKVFEFLLRLRKEFVNWFGKYYFNNRNYDKSKFLSFSGSYFIFNYKQPVKYVYDEAEKLLKEAKYISMDEEKNKINFMGAIVKNITQKNEEDYSELENKNIKEVLEYLKNNKEGNVEFEVLSHWIYLIMSALNKKIENSNKTVFSSSLVYFLTKVFEEGFSFNKKLVPIKELAIIKYKLKRNVSEKVVQELFGIDKKDLIELYEEWVKKIIEDIFSDKGNMKAKCMEVSHKYSLKQKKVGKNE